jgi:hypothetical protein
MSETKCKCGHERDDHLNGIFGCLGGWVIDDKEINCGCDDYEPVIEVAPGEPHEHCDYCFTVKPCVLEDSSGRMMCQDCLDKAAASTGAPAVPAQEAPREHNARPFELSGKAIAAFSSVIKALASAEPQAGAQVPSQDAIREKLKDSSVVHVGILRGDIALTKAQAIHIAGLPADIEDRLARVVSYATEAAKTPIAREDMHDPLKAQTFYDETFGWIRLVLSEIGGGL